LAESQAWQSAHYEEPYYSRRLAKFPRKLGRLGILGWQRDARVLDACCGRGEALTYLRGQGFRHTYGIDLTAPGGGDAESHREISHGDIRTMPFADASFDAVLNLHALHHLEGPRGVEAFLRECHRILKPGGRLMIIDFPASWQIRLLFWLLLHRAGTISGGMRNFAAIVEEEWSYLGKYLRAWPEVRRVLANGPLRVVSWRQRVFLYYLTLEKAK
jgi:ubiquinone/menaquinone biosynthesis C-methylase UbiE